MTLFAALKPFSRAVLDTLLRPHCLGCDMLVPADGQFCMHYFRQVNFISKPFCASCAVPLPFGEIGGQGGICAICEAVPSEFSQAWASLRYDNAAKKLILPFKYADRTKHACGLALLMAKAGSMLLTWTDVLVPVPLHISRLR